MLKNELKQNEINISGIFPGPKSYSCITSLGTEVVKCQGFTLNYKNEQLIKFNSLTDFVESFCSNNEIKEIITTNDHKITRDKKNMRILNKKEVKHLKFVFNKKVISDDNFTLPYGN